MKTLLKIIIGFVMILNISAQNLERTSFKINVKDNSISTLKLNQKLVVMKGLQINLLPQIGNQFISQIEARKAKIDLKEYYNDYDLGFIVGLDYLLKTNLNLRAHYNLGILKFDFMENEKTQSVLFKLTLNYYF